MKNAAGTTVYGIITTNGTVVLNAYYTAIYYMQRNGNITYYFNKPANNELLTLKELLSTRETVKELIEQTKGKEAYVYPKAVSELNFNAVPATYTTEANGYYEFVGVVPGKYYIKYTYSNGSVVYKGTNEETNKETNNE